MVTPLHDGHSQYTRRGRYSAIRNPLLRIVPCRADLPVHRHVLPRRGGIAMFGRATKVASILVFRGVGCRGEWSKSLLLAPNFSDMPRRHVCPRPCRRPMHHDRSDHGGTAGRRILQRDCGPRRQRTRTQGYCQGPHSRAVRPHPPAATAPPSWARGGRRRSRRARRRW